MPALTDVARAEGATPASESLPVLGLSGVRLRFGHREVIRGVDLTVRVGQVVVLIGASGSGKTSLLRCINLLNRPFAGRIEIDGERIFDQDERGVDRLRLRYREVNRIRADGTPSDVPLRPTHPRLQSFVARFRESADMLRPFLETR